MFQSDPIGYCYVTQKTVHPETMFQSAVIVYNIRTDALPDAVVERTYEDFQWLAEQMYQDYPGYIAPALPETISEYFDNRLLTLEQYLNRLASHKVLRKSMKLETFLLGNDASMVSMKEQYPGVPTLIVGATWLNRTFSFLTEVGHSNFITIDHVFAERRAGSDVPTQGNRPDLRLHPEDRCQDGAARRESGCSRRERL